MSNPIGRLAPKLLVVMLLVSALAVMGCGGGEEETATTVSTVAPADQENSADSAEEQSIEGQEVVPGEDTPEEIKSALERNRPLVVMFYVVGGTDDGLVQDAVDNLEVKFPDIAFARYDYRNPEEYGDLASLLKVDYTPAVVLVDATGHVHEAFSGYVDEGSLNQGLTNLH